MPVFGRAEAPEVEGGKQVDHGFGPILIDAIDTPSRHDLFTLGGCLQK